MARNQTVISSQPNLLALNRVRKQCYYQPIRVDFSSIQKPNNQFQNIVPFFNNDKNYFTPAFILQKQKISLLQNYNQEKNKFEARIKHNLTQSTNQTIEYRPTDSKYCQICKFYFQQYWQHINGKHHQNTIKKSKFNKDITELCLNFNGKNLINKQQKTKYIEKKKPNHKKNNSRNSKIDKISKFDNLKLRVNQCKIQKRDSTQNHQIENNIRKGIQQSLKITLQLGNYSTNIISNNQFKQLT